MCGSVPSRSHMVSAALKESSWSLWGVQSLSQEQGTPDPRQEERRVALREGHGGDHVPALPCPSFLSLLVPRMAAAKKGWMVTTGSCWMCCGSLRACLGCPVTPEVVTQALGRSAVLWKVLSVLGFTYNLYFLCFRCQG